MDTIIGIDLGGTAIKAALINSQGLIMSEITQDTEAHKGAKTILNNIIKASKKLLEINTTNKLLAIGLGTPGILNREKTKVIGCAHNLSNWENFPFVDKLQQYFNVPVYAHNDVNLMGYGEFKKGAATKATNALFITLGTGIGGSIILNRCLYEGSSGFAGEVGHMLIVQDGRQCGCGSKGCFEAYASATALTSFAKESNVKIVPLTAKSIFHEAANKNPLAETLVKNYINYLSIGIANLINIFNPDTFIIGGGVSQSKEALIQPLLPKIQEKTLPLNFSHCTIKLAELGNKAGMIGAGCWAIDNL